MIYGSEYMKCSCSENLYNVKYKTRYKAMWFDRKSKPKIMNCPNCKKPLQFVYRGILCCLPIVIVNYNLLLAAFSNSTTCGYNLFSSPFAIISIIIYYVTLPAWLHIIPYERDDLMGKSSTKNNPTCKSSSTTDNANTN